MHRPIISLNAKLILMMLSLSVILISSLLFLYPRAEQRTLQEVERHTRKLSKAIEISMMEATGTDSIDISKINRYLDSMNIKGIEEIAILNTSNTVIASTNQSIVGTVMADDKKELLGEKEGSYNLVFPVVARDTLLGHIRLRINREDIAQILRENAVYRIEATVIVFSLGMFIAWILSRKYTNPIRKLATAARQVAAGDLNQNISVRSMDEIGQLAESFNFMVEKLRENRTLEERLREAEHLSSIGQISRSVAHEIRNPLNFLNLSISHIEEKYRPEDGRKKEQFNVLIEGIKLEIQRLNKFVNDFLDYGRPIRLDKKMTSVTALVEEVLNLVRPKAEAEGVKVEREYGTEKELYIDGDIFKSCLVNIISNAFQAMIGTDRKKILAIRTGLEGDRFVLVIKDTGRGVPATDIEKVFEPFFSTKPEGLGLGLSITRRVIEEHGGSVEFFSAEGEGSEFRMTFPLPYGKETGDTGGKGF